MHIEARVNWSAEGEAPEGTPRGGFVPYLKINAEVVNERTKEITFVTLTPHINLIDNLHYARNMGLPSEKTDKYTVTFFILPSEVTELLLHKDWWIIIIHVSWINSSSHSKSLDFKTIAKASRR